MNIDETLTRGIYSIDNSVFVKLFKGADLFYYPLTIGVMTMGSYSLVNPSFLPGSQTVLISYVISFIIERLLKKVVKRSRPWQTLPGLTRLSSGNLGDFEQATSSFPSGHAMGTFAIVTSLGILIANDQTLCKSKKVTAIVTLYVLATLITVNRSRVAMHWFSDITVGALLGTLIAILVSKFIPGPYSWPSNLIDKVFFCSKPTSTA